MKNKNKILITAALPYINGPLHIGQLVGCLLPSDVYARFCRARGADVLHICGSDDHGTPVVVGAQKASLPVEEYAQLWRDKQRKSIKFFNLAFDYYGQTHTPEQTRLVQSLFTEWDKLGLIEERTMHQPYSVDDKLFLADRFIKGTCPRCGYDRADGDQCEKCGALLEPTELINPYSAISGSHNIEIRETKHLYFKYSKTEKALRKWIDSRQDWPKTALAIANKWLAEGLRDVPITRDLNWGIPVNKPGYEDKVFYVWFDAPWGYVSISQAATPDWANWWKAGDKCHYAQFMGKDNVAFHSIFFPAQELALKNDNWKTVDLLKAVNFLNFEGVKISKSLGNGVFLEDAPNDAPSDCWRYVLMASAPETDDTDFTVQRFADIVNKDLNGMLGNFVSRVCKMTEKNFGNTVPVGAHNCAQLPRSGNKVIAPDGAMGRNYAPLRSELEQTLNAKLAELTTALEKCEFRKAVESLRAIWAAGNEFFTKTAPWDLVKTDKDLAGAVLNECFQLIDFYARVSAPFIPDAAEKMNKVFSSQLSVLSWPQAYERRIADGTPFVVPENLFARIDDAKIAEMVEKYTQKRPKIVIAKILTAVPHPDSDHLQVCSVDFGDGAPLQIVCGAPNAREGLVTVLAKVGAKLPAFDAPMVQKKVHGVVSNGMLCAADELGLSAAHDGILELPEDSEIGKEFKIN